MHFDILRWLTGLKLYRKTDEKQKYSIYIYIARLCAFERKDLCSCDEYMRLNRVFTYLRDKDLLLQKIPLLIPKLDNIRPKR